MDSFRPVLTVEKREDMFDWKMGIVRIVSCVMIVNGGLEFIKEPQKWEDLKKGADEAITEAFRLGQNKFLGIPDNST